MEVDGPRSWDCRWRGESSAGPSYDGMPVVAVPGVDEFDAPPYRREPGWMLVWDAVGSCVEGDT